MSIQSFTEKAIKDIESLFENDANKLLNEARQRSGNESYVAGHMDGLSDAVKKLQESYKLFVKPDNQAEEDDARPLY